MTNENKKALRDIMHDLKCGYSYGKDYTWNYYENKPMRFPYFGAAIYPTASGNFGYQHFGSSAIRPTLRELEWLITVIFKTTPAEFLREYIRNDKSEISY